MLSRFVAFGAAVALLVHPARAQDRTTTAGHLMDSATSQAAFRVGATTAWTIGVPHIDLNGGFFYAAEKDAAPEIQTGFVSARFQAGLGTPNVQLAANAIVVPSLGGAPELTTVLQIVPTRPESAVHLSIGGGMIAGRYGSPSRADLYVEAVLGARTPIHVIAPFVQVGQALRTGAQTQLLVGAAHPLMPYRFHLWH